MADHTRIEWTDATWNVVTGCTLVSEGCKNCYAAELAAGRLRNLPSRRGLARRNAAGVAAFTGEVRFNRDWLGQPLHWQKPRRIFVCAHGDLFHESVPDEWIDKVFANMALCPRHIFQVLTKRPGRMREYIAARTIDRALLGPVANLIADFMGDTCSINWTPAWPLPNVWLGVSAEDQATADARIPPLLDTPAAVRFLSAEPLLGPIDLDATPMVYVTENTDPETFSAIDWVIAGGESGRRARPMHPDWARSLRDQCHAASVPFFFKQWGEWVSVSEVAGPGPHHHFDDGATVRRTGKRRAGRLLDGQEWSQMPEGAP